MKSSRISAILALFALFAGATVIAACSSDSNSGGSVDSELIQSGTLTVGSDIPFPPFEFGRAAPGADRSGQNPGPSPEGDHAHRGRQEPRK